MRNVNKMQKRTRLRKKLKSRTERYRLSVFRSNKYVYAQIIDDSKGKTLVAAGPNDILSDSAGKQNKKGKTKTGSMNKQKVAKMVGELIAQRAKVKKIKQVVFDRGSYKYHGCVKSVAEAARSKGLLF